MERHSKDDSRRSKSSGSATSLSLEQRLKRIEDFIMKTNRRSSKSRSRRNRSRSRSNTSSSEPSPSRPRRRVWSRSSPDSSEQEPLSPRHPYKRKSHGDPDSREQEPPTPMQPCKRERLDPDLSEQDPPMNNEEKEIVKLPPDHDTEPSTEQFVTLKEEILECLGADPNEIPNKNFELHPALASRWATLIKNGLDKEERLELTKEYLVPTNLQTLNPPEINEEIVKIVSRDILKKDRYLCQIQTQLATALSALGTSLNRILGEEHIEFKITLIELCDVGKLLADLHHYISISRRYGILPCIDKSLRQLVVKTGPDSHLFGVDFAEKVKTARELEQNLRASTSRPESSVQTSNRQGNWNAGHLNRDLNWRGPPRTLRKYRQQGQKPQQNYRGRQINPFGPKF